MGVNRPEDEDLSPVSVASLDLQSVSFDQAFAGQESYVGALRSAGEGQVAKLLGLGQQGAKAAKIIHEGSRLRVVFSKETTKKLRSGALRLPVDKKTGLLRIDARDAKGRIREMGKLRKAGGAGMALNLVVGAAHVISAADMQARLESIDRKLDQLMSFVRADRLGELRAAYGGIRKALCRRDPGRRDKEIDIWSTELQKLQGRFFQTAQDRLDKIRDPSDIGIWESLTTRQSTAEAELRQALAEVFTDYKAMNFCSLLLELSAAQTSDIEGIPAIRSERRQQLEQVRGQLIEKTAYLDFDLRDAMTQILEFLQAVSVPPPKDLQLEGNGGDTLLMQPILETGGSHD